MRCIRIICSRSALIEIKTSAMKNCTFMLIFNKKRMYKGVYKEWANKKHDIAYTIELLNTVYASTRHLRYLLCLSRLIAICQYHISKNIIANFVYVSELQRSLQPYHYTNNQQEIYRSGLIWFYRYYLLNGLSPITHHITNYIHKYDICFTEIFALAKYA